MENTSWTSELETGISALDLDNRALLDLIRRVIAASAETDRDQLKSSLLALQTETVAHFEREERLMNECKYLAAAEHQAEHRQLAVEIQHQIDDLQAGQGNLSFIGRFMHNWLRQHIVSKDALFGQALITQQGTTDRRHESIDTQAPEEEIDIFEERRLGNLEPIVWTAKLALGIEPIDAQHRALIGRYNAILVTSKSADKARLATLLEQLGNETAAHFENEELLMSGADYEHAATHKEEHRKLLEELAHQVDDWRKNHISAELLCRFMYLWLLRHIVALDRPLAEAIKRQNKDLAASAALSRPATATHDQAIG